MRRIAFVLLGFWLGVLSGCGVTNLTTTTADTTTSTTVEAFDEYDGYASTVTISQVVLPTTIQWPGLSFEARYHDVTVSPVAQVVCVTASLYDINFRNASYVLVGRYVGESLEETRHNFVSNTSSISYRTCFSDVRLNRSYEILLAKTDTDVPEAHSVLYSVVTLTLYDPEANRRAVVWGDASINQTPETLDMDQTSFVSYAPRLIDEDRAIASITFVLTTRDHLKEFERRVIPVTEAMYAGDRLEVPLQVFDQLAPGLEYAVRTTMSGNDGIDDFVDAPVMTSYLMAPTYRGSETLFAQHDLYAVIRGFEVVEDQVVFQYDIVNQTGIAQTFEAHIRTPGSNGESIEDIITLDPSEHAFHVPVTQLAEGAAVYLRNTATPSVVFDQRFIDVHKNDYIVAYEFAGNGTITFEIREEDYTTTEFCYLELYNASGTLLDSFNLQSYEAGQFHRIATGIRYQDHPGIWGKIVYRVETEIGGLTHESILNLIPW